MTVTSPTVADVTAEDPALASRDVTAPAAVETAALVPVAGSASGTRVASPAVAEVTAVAPVAVRRLAGVPLVVVTAAQVPVAA